MTDRPDVSARGSIEVFEAHGMLTWHDEKMAGRDFVSRDPRHLWVANGRIAAAESSGEDFAVPPLGSALFAVWNVLPFVGNALSFAAGGVLIRSIRPATAPPYRNLRRSVIGRDQRRAEVFHREVRVEERVPAADGDVPPEALQDVRRRET